MRSPWSDEEPRRILLERRDADVTYLTVPTERALPCHPGLSYLHANLEFLIVHRETRETLRGSGLLVHLIRDHHFFEGKASPFRIDPERAVRVLGLEPPPN
ncbi:MAG TPA: hypothetical protein VH165_13360 [Kofleriaceae bacterium]|nr:hypothetical protein [Kofleriaceae bacterium]